MFYYFVIIPLNMTSLSGGHAFFALCLHHLALGHISYLLNEQLKICYVESLSGVASLSSPLESFLPFVICVRKSKLKLDLEEICLSVSW